VVDGKTLERRGLGSKEKANEERQRMKRRGKWLLMHLTFIRIAFLSFLITRLPRSYIQATEELTYFLARPGQITRTFSNNNTDILTEDGLKGGDEVD
jgi:hypothetical protein